MALNPTPFFPATPQAQRCQLTSTSAGTGYTGGANGSKVSGVVATSTDTAAQTLTVAIVHSATTYELGCVSIPIGAGTGTTNQAVNVLSAIPGLPVDNDGNPYVYLVSGDTLTFTLGAITSGKHVNAHCFGTDF